MSKLCCYIIKVSATPVIIGTRMLSLIGSGSTSIVIAIAAPANASHGETKNNPAKSAKKKPANEPSHVFPLLNGKELEMRPPKIEAAASPKQNMAIAALPAWVGNSRSVATIPKAK